MPQFHSRFTLPFGYADATNIVFHNGGVVDRLYSKGTNDEDTDGINFARSTRQYWPQDWLLAGRICCTVLCLQRRWRPTNTHFSEGRTATDRSKKRRTGKSNRRDGSVQTRPGSATSSVTNDQTSRRE